MQELKVILIAEVFHTTITHKNSLEFSKKYFFYILSFLNSFYIPTTLCQDSFFWSLHHLYLN